MRFASVRYNTQLRRIIRCAVGLGWVAVIGVAYPAAAEDAGQRASGSVSQMGFGKIVLKEKDGIARTFLEGRRDTAYDPQSWRPEVGDEIEITYIQREQKLVATTVHLVEVGPNNVDPAKMTSPMDVTIVEVGRSGIIGTRGDDPRRIRFAFARSTQYEPVGWKPLVGEKVSVIFQAKQNFFTFNVSFVIDKIARGN